MESTSMFFSEDSPKQEIRYTSSGDDNAPAHTADVECDFYRLALIRAK
jgi:hypothetical protein